MTGELYLEAPLPGMGRRLTGAEGKEMFRNDYFKRKLQNDHELFIILIITVPIPTDKLGKTLYCTSDIVHRDEDGDYQVYGRVNDAIRYRGELLNLPNIEGAAVSQDNQPTL